MAIVAATLALGPADLWAAQRVTAPAAEEQALKRMAQAMPLGSRVKVRTITGRTLKGTLMAVDDDAVIIKRRSRLPEPAVTIPFSELGHVELQLQEGMSAGKIIGLGLAVGAGAILTLIAFAFALDD